MKNLQVQDRNNICHERVPILKGQGYRGFTISRVQGEWDGVKITAADRQERYITGAGEMRGEAYLTLIENMNKSLEVH